MALHEFYLERIPMLLEVERLGGFLTPEGAAEWERFWASAEGYTPPDVRMEARLVSARSGNPPVPIRVYRPAADGDTSGAGLVWVHGGGFTGGDIGMFEADGVARELVARTGGVVVSVDYRLADETTWYPAPVEDVIDVWRWAKARSVALGVGQDRWMLGGASAGAALSAAAVATLRDDEEALPRTLILIYPLVHSVIPPLSHELAAKVVEVPGPLNYGRPDSPSQNGSPITAYLGGPAWLANGHSFAGQGDPSGFPRTLIVNSEYDALRASGQRFAAQLVEAGVDVTVRNEPGVLHGHLNFPPVIEPIDATLSTMAAAMVEG